jgi:CO/xanthine dehydrogenase Mo-binding subunit
VWTAADIADLPPIDFRDPAAEALRPYRQPLLARERLRYVGEPIAAVLATDPYLAEDGAELISVEAEVLTLILDASAAPTSFAPGLSASAAQGTITGGGAAWPPRWPSRDRRGCIR